MTKIKILVIARVVLFAFVIPALAGRIHEAAKRGDVVEINSLLAKDPKLVEAKDNKYGQTPLHLAAFRGHKEVVEVLRKHGGIE